jgi:hypothetical protein
MNATRSVTLESAVRMGAGSSNGSSWSCARPPSGPCGERPRPGAVGAVLAGLLVLALALAPALVVLGGGQDRVGNSERERPAISAPAVGSVVQRVDGPHVVVATGTAPIAGPWQMETYTSERLADPDTGEEYQPTGLRCLGLAVLDHGGWSGQCGEIPRTPGFSPLQESVPNPGAPGPVREILVYGRAPERASAVRVTAARGFVTKAQFFEGPEGTRGDFYLVAIPPDLRDSRVNWIDRDGRPGSRGHALLPP